MTDTPSIDWTIRWRGQTWTDRDLTGQHLATLALLSGDDRFEDLSITEADLATYPGEGYMRLMNMIGAFVTVAATDGIDDPDDAHEAAVKALARIQRAPAEEILASITFTEAAVG